MSSSTGNMRRKPELLSPAGNKEALLAAERSGADAVYLGGKTLNARRGAGNFDSDELKWAGDYLHERGKKLYVTVNTLLKQSEIGELELLAKDLSACGADAAIVQDAGVCAILRQILPSIHLHASTQMAVHNVQGAKYLKDRGFERVVLAREMSLNEIKECSALGIETEVFCHGALCVACSGQCLFSSLVGGRSGNRGACAQPCRLPYKLNGAVKSDGYLLSPKDLMTAGYLKEIAEAGAASLKIEGRLKRPEYVAIVTSVYRRVLDGEPFTERDEEELKQIFNRGGFTRGYALGIRDGDFISKARPSHFGVKIGEAVSHGEIRLVKDVLAADSIAIRSENAEDVPVKISGFAGRSIKNPAGKTGTLYRMVSDEQMKAAAQSVEKEKQTIPLCGKLTLKVNESASLTVSDGTDSVTVSGETVQKANSSAADKDKITTQLGKTGGTPYFFETIEIDADTDAFAPSSMLNALRRDALAILAEERIASHRGAGEIVAKPAIPEYETLYSEKPRLMVQSDDSQLLRKLLNAGADGAVWFPSDLRIEALERADADGMFLYLPAVAAGKDLNVLHDWAERNKNRLAGVYISNIGQMALSWAGEIRYDFPLNLANTPALAFLGAEDAVYTPSVELTSREMMSLGGKKELIVYGRLPLMHLRHCPLNSARNGGQHTACRACDKAADGKKLIDCTLTDRMKAEFPLRRLAGEEGCVIDLLNSVPLNLIGRMDELPACVSYRLLFSTETEAEAEAVTAAFRDAINGKTNGKDVLPAKFTTGHYFRRTE